VAHHAVSDTAHKAVKKLAPSVVDIATRASLRSRAASMIFRGKPAVTIVARWLILRQQHCVFLLNISALHLRAESTALRHKEP
jgi:hypothetical protein